MGRIREELLWKSPHTCREPRKRLPNSHPWFPYYRCLLLMNQVGAPAPEPEAFHICPSSPFCSHLHHSPASAFSLTKMPFYTIPIYPCFQASLKPHLLHSSLPHPPKLDT